MKNTVFHILLLSALFSPIYSSHDITLTGGYPHLVDITYRICLNKIHLAINSGLIPIESLRPSIQAGPLFHISSTIGIFLFEEIGYHYTLSSWIAQSTADNNTNTSGRDNFFWSNSGIGVIVNPKGRFICGANIGICPMWKHVIGNVKNEVIYDRVAFGFDIFLGIRIGQ